MMKISMVGNLGRDPETKSSRSGDYVTFSLAVKMKKEETQWVRCLIWPDRLPAFEKMLKWIKKGSLVWVEGRLEQPKVFHGKNGDSGVNVSVSVTDINFVPGGKKEGTEGTKDYKTYEPGEIKQGQGKSEFQEEPDLPF